MEVKISPGFLFIDFGSSPFFVVSVHSDTSFNILPRGDVGTGLVARRVGEELKCKVLISLVPKSGYLGINLNRLLPSYKTSAKLFEYTFEKNYEKAHELGQSFAFGSSNKKDYLRRKKIFDSFWNLLRKFRKKDFLFAFLHTQSSILKNLPSILDLSFYQTLENEIGRKIVEKANKKFAKKLKLLSEEFLDYTLFSTRFYYANIIRMKYGKFDYKLFREESKEFFDGCVARAKELNEEAFKKLRSKSLKSLLEATRLAFRRPEITFEKNFFGTYALAPKKFLDGEKIAQLEISSFLTECYPDLASELVCFILQNLKIFGSGRSRTATSAS